MNIPSKDECEKLLLKYNFPERKRRHVEKVAEVAAFLGKRLQAISNKQEAISIKINLDLMYAGGMLHDIDKGVEGAGVVHPSKGIEILRAEGYPEVARICETHTINAFLDPKTIPTTWEEKCVALADKMVKNEVIGVTERFRLWRGEVEAELGKVSKVSKVSNVSNERDNWEAQRRIIEESYVKVKELEKEICEIIGLKAEEIINIFKLTYVSMLTY